MFKYFPIFREFRLNRQFSLKQVASNELSVSQLSRFERGESDLSLTKFLGALEAIDLSISEFMDRVNKYQKSDQISLMSQMAQYHYQRDVAGLEKMISVEEGKLKKDSSDIRCRLNIVLFRGMICECDSSRKMSEEDLCFLSDYLFQKDSWEISDYILIGNLYRYYNTRHICQLVKEVINQKEYYRDIYTNRNVVEATLLNVVETLIERRALEEATFFLEKVEALLNNERNAYHRIILLYEKGFLAYAKGDSRGIQSMKQAIFCFQAIGSKHHVENFQEHFNRVTRL
ncbi:TPA: MutR family transcriptional regulator [Streptococcus agalactiae]|nr:MutR family transcriptional regulator [Streptococcus agalactiae]